MIEKKKRFKEKEAKEILFQIVLGLRAIHEKAIAHRDMKGSNIFIKNRTEGGSIYKIGDFGLAI